MNELVELNKKLILWVYPKAKFRDAEYRHEFIISGKPYRTHSIDYRSLISFTGSLDYCFQLLVPKLKELGWMVRVQYSPLRDGETLEVISGWTGYASIYDVSGKKGINNFEHWAIAETAPLALCKAIEQLIDSETSK
jgi:hypothetical protein